MRVLLLLLFLVGAVLGRCATCTLYVANETGRAFGQWGTGGSSNIVYSTRNAASQSSSGFYGTDSGSVGVQTFAGGSAMVVGVWYLCGYLGGVPPVLLGHFTWDGLTDTFQSYRVESGFSGMCFTGYTNVYRAHASLTNLTGQAQTYASLSNGIPVETVRVPPGAAYTFDRQWTDNWTDWGMGVLNSDGAVVWSFPAGYATNAYTTLTYSGNYAPGMTGNGTNSFTDLSRVDGGGTAGDRAIVDGLGLLREQIRTNGTGGGGIYVSNVIGVTVTNTGTDLGPLTNYLHSMNSMMTNWLTQVWTNYLDDYGTNWTSAQAAANSALSEMDESWGVVESAILDGPPDSGGPGSQDPFIMTFCGHEINLWPDAALGFDMSTIVYNVFTWVAVVVFIMWVGHRFSEINRTIYAGRDQQQSALMRLASFSMWFTPGANGVRALQYVIAGLGVTVWVVVWKYIFEQVGPYMPIIGQDPLTGFTDAALALINAFIPWSLILSLLWARLSLMYILEVMILKIAAALRWVAGSAT